VSSEADDRAESTGQALVARELRRYRERAGMSLSELAVRIGYSRTYISTSEKPGAALVSKAVVARVDQELDAGGDLIRLQRQAAAERRTRRVVTTRAPRTERTRAIATVDMFTESISAELKDSGGDRGGESVIFAPRGRFFGGATIPARVYPATNDGRIVTSVPARLVDDPFMRQSRRGLIIGAESHDVPQFFGLDVRQARRRLNAVPDGSRLLIPSAYAIDDLTLGLLWAVANFDDALLGDDAELSASREAGDAFEGWTRSAAGREIAGDLAPVSRMWLGSNFCAGHVLRHASTLDSVPAFWSQEQRGEEASTWLFFQHKYDYLRRTVEIFSGSGSSASRSFCIPRRSVGDSGPPERMLLMLALTLMESFGIRVDVCDEPEYAAIHGFVLDEGRRAIVANWVGADGIWHVDVTDARPRVREFVDAIRNARSRSVIAAQTAAGRLRLLAEYLDLDIVWLARRCTELADYGTAGIVLPRSRLLSVDGVDRACRFLAQQLGPELAVTQ
jgi:transcriptional regulator with XRE-family HTH domain